MKSSEKSYHPFVILVLEEVPVSKVPRRLVSHTPVLLLRAPLGRIQDGVYNIACLAQERCG